MGAIADCIKRAKKKYDVWSHLFYDWGYNKRRKPPNTLYSFLLHPIRNKKYLLQKGQLM